MSSVEDIEAAIPKLSPGDLARFRAWFDDYCEDRMELREDVKAELDKAREDIRSGNYRTPQPR
jgi:hypothetical protein